MENQIVDHVPLTIITPTKENTAKLPDDFGKKLDTPTKARIWLTNPHNWHSTHLYILRWDGLLPTVNHEEGLRLLREPWDMGLPEVAVWLQRELRRGHNVPGRIDHSNDEGKE